MLIERVAQCHTAHFWQGLRLVYLPLLDFLLVTCEPLSTRAGGTVWGACAVGSLLVVSEGLGENGKTTF